MIFGHVYKRPTLLFVPSRLEIHDTLSGRVSQRVPGKVLRFKEISPGIPTNKLPTRYGGNRLVAKLDTELEARRLKVPEEQIIAFLKNHPSYGVTMIAVNDETTQAVGNETGLGDGVTANGDGSFTCTVCDNRYFQDSRGVAQHCASKGHLENLEAKREELTAVTVEVA